MLIKLLLFIFLVATFHIFLFAMILLQCSFCKILFAPFISCELFLEHWSDAACRLRMHILTFLKRSFLNFPFATTFLQGTFHNGLSKPLISCGLFLDHWYEIRCGLHIAGFLKSLKVLLLFYFHNISSAVSISCGLFLDRRF